MHQSLPPLNALRAFEAAARHLSLTKAAAELSVTPGALSHQIRGLEEFLGVKLFDRGTRSIALTAEGKQLFPGLMRGFDHIREAVSNLRARPDSNVLVISSPPGFTSKWLAPRLYRFAEAHPDIDPRVSSTMALANLRTDGIDLGLRTLPIGGPIDPALAALKLIDIFMVPVMSPRLLDRRRPIKSARDVLRLPLIHDDSMSSMPGWAEWCAAAGLEDVDLRRGPRFSSPDHALDAVIEGSGVLITNSVLAFDDLRTGRLVVPFALSLPANRAYHLVTLQSRRNLPNVAAFRAWIVAEVAAMEKKTPPRRTQGGAPRHSNGQKG